MASNQVFREGKLSTEEQERYNRQMILPGISSAGQLILKQTSVVIVGVGGLGCPAAAYLAGAGLGTIGLIDGDLVSASNLHRQIIHSSHTVGDSKVSSAVRYLRGLNPLISYDTHYAFLTPENAIQLLKPYDVVLDCLDNPQSRYLLSDACIALGKPLVTASALGFEGQLMVLNFPTMPPGHLNGGPCYRCIFPVPQPAEMTQTCGEAGILGPVVGTMGTMMALETIKVIFRRDDDLSDEDPTMLIFSALTAPQFRSIKLRSRQTTCPSCSATTKISMDSIARDPSAYDRLCGVTSPTVQILDRSERVTPEEYHLMLRSEELRARRSSPFRTRQLTADELQYDSRADYGGAQDRNRSLSPKRPQARDLASPTHILLDVRPAAHFNLTRPLSHAVNVPYSDLHTILPGYHPPLSTPNSTSHSTSTTSLTPAPPLSSFNAYSIPGLGELIHPTGLPRDVMAGISSNLPLYVVCGNGNDSQRVVRRMKDAGMDFGGKRRIVDLLGGWAAWDGGVGGRALEVG